MSQRKADSESVDIRAARRADLLDVYRLERECFPSPWPYQAFLDHLDAPAFILAIADDELAGYLVADIASHFPGRVGHIKDLAVSPTHRREGVGSGLLDAGITRLQENGAISVSLEVRRENQPARALYRQFGFTDHRIEPGYYEDGTDAIVMHRSLSTGSTPV